MKSPATHTCLIRFLLIAILFIPSPTSAAELTVFAASSLTEVFQTLAEAFTHRTGTVVKCHFSGSQIVRFQLEQGAPADVIALADPALMTALLRQRLVATPQIFACNRLELIVSPYAANRLRHFADLALPGTLLVIGNEQVPVGHYTRQLLSQLDDPVLAEKILHNVVSEETNVKGIVTKVLLGEADAGFVYATDLTPQLKIKGVTAVALPRHDPAAEFSPVAAYSVAATTTTGQPAAAQAFVDFLLSTDGQQILRQWNFTGVTP